MANQIVVRAWHRRKDRSVIERWPAAELPAHWIQSADENDGRRVSWAIDQDGQLVGRITLRGFNQDRARLGIYLHPGCYGQGIGTEALRQFVGLAPVSTLRLDVRADNQRAIRCYQNAGFRTLYYTWPAIGNPIAIIEMERQIYASDRAAINRLIPGPVH